MNFSDYTAASTAPRIYGDIYSMLNQKHLKARRYKAFKNLILTNIDIPISGLEWTTIDNIHSSQMVPQGLCCANQYLLMTSYAHKPAFCQNCPGCTEYKGRKLCKNNRDRACSCRRNRLSSSKRICVDFL